MPRIKTIAKKIKKKTLPPEWRRLNERAQLEKQLSGVVERDHGARSAEHRTSSREHEAGSTKQGARSREHEAGSTKQNLDKSLVSTLKAKSTLSRRVPIAITRGDHKPSGYVLPLVISLYKTAKEERFPLFAEMTEWLAPFEEPPSLEALAILSADLHVDEVDPSIFSEQYTPIDPDHAYRASYGIWSVLAAPFYRLEAAAVRSHPLRRLEAAAEEVKEAEEELWSAPVIVPRLAVGRVVAGLLVLLSVVSLPAGASSIARSLSGSWSAARQSGENALSSVKQALASDGGQAEAWRQASADLAAADRALNDVGSLSVALGEALPRTRAIYGSARALVSAGGNATKAVGLIAAGLERSLQVPARHPVDRLQIFTTYLDEASPLLDDATLEMAAVRFESLPAKERQEAESMRDLLSEARASVRELRVLTSFLSTALGSQSQRRYLFIFQNPSEIRPTGGFMGSFADITFDRGEIKQITVPGGGPYDLRSQLKTRLQPPEPLQLVAERWEFQDTNWSPDFPTAAETIRRFWSEAGQPTIDGLVAVNAPLVVRVLAVTGPIDLPDYGKTITAENFMSEIQKSVELEYDRQENQPKKIIGDILPKILDKLKSLPASDWPKLAKLFVESLETRDIQIALFDPTGAEIAERFNWGSRLRQSKGDSLAIVNTNIAGQKTDAVIDERVKLAVDIASDGSIKNTLTITRSHKGQKGDLFSGVNNVNYLRVYVPDGATLLSASGFKTPSSRLFKKPLADDQKDVRIATVEEGTTQGPGSAKISRDLGRTVVSGWTQVMPGEATTLKLEYKLPMTVFDIADAFAGSGGRGAYVLELTSQSGMARRSLETSIEFPEAWKAEWIKPAVNGSWVRDELSAVIFDSHERS